LANGQALGQVVLTSLVVAALVIGGGISLVSAFFGLVIPRRVGGPWGDPKTWAEWGKKWKQWEHEAHARHGWHRRGAPWRRDEDEVQDGERQVPPRRRR
jgi:hypothetical protein